MFFTLEQEKVNKFQQLIEKAEKIVIITHVSPDGDAMGSSLAMSAFLNLLGKENQVVVPNEFPVFLGWMPGAENILIHFKQAQKVESLILNCDLLLCLDFNTPERVEMLKGVLLQAKNKVLIDHHIEPSNDFLLRFTYPQASSTSELVFRLLEAMGEGKNLNQDIATAIYTGMMTDTGAFSYNSNDPEIFIIIGKLLEYGIDKDKIYQRVFQNYSAHRMRLMGYVLYEKMKLYPEYRTALISLNNEEMERFNYEIGDAEGFVNLPLSINDVDFVVFFREAKRYIKVSFRSIGDIPCNTFASRYFNGGGHKNASGGEFYGTMEEAQRIFEEGIGPFFRELKENL